MATLAVDKARAFELGDYNDWPVIAADIIYEGALIGDNASGYARPLAAGDPPRGFAESNVDNTAGGAGAKNVRVRQRGRVQLAVANLAITDVGKPVYASDDDTFVLTATSNSHVGRVVRFIATGVGIVEFDFSRGSIGLIGALTHAVGTADGTVADVGASFNQTTLNDNFRELSDKINALAKILA